MSNHEVVFLDFDQSKFNQITRFKISANQLEKIFKIM